MAFRTLVPLGLLAIAGCDNAADRPVAPAPSGTREAASAASPARPDMPLSRYTSLTNCAVVERRADEDWSVSRCAGEGGYALMLDYGDAREDLRLAAPDGRMTDLGLNRLAAGAFNALGPAAEWRGRVEAGRFVPRALIVRDRLVIDPERPEAPLALLVVVDLTRACLIGQVRPGPSQNVQARAVADDARARPCLKVQSGVSFRFRDFRVVEL